MPTARDVMTQSMLTVDANWTLQEVAIFLEQNNITGAPVLDERKGLIGMISVTDLARAWQAPNELTASEELLHRIAVGLDASDMTGFGVESLASRTVADVMTPVVFSVEEYTPVEEIADMMIRARIHRVVVMRGRTPIGIVSALDLLRTVGYRQPAPAVIGESTW